MRWYSLIFGYIRKWVFTLARWFDSWLGAVGRVAGPRCCCSCSWDAALAASVFGLLLGRKRGLVRVSDSAWSNCKMSEMRSGNAWIRPHARTDWPTPAYATCIGPAHASAQWLHPNAWEPPTWWPPDDLGHVAHGSSATFTSTTSSADFFTKMHFLSLSASFRADKIWNKRGIFIFFDIYLNNCGKGFKRGGGFKGEKWNFTVNLKIYTFLISPPEKAVKKG